MKNDMPIDIFVSMEVDHPSNERADSIINIDPIYGEIKMEKTGQTKRWEEEIILKSSDTKTNI